MFFEIGRMIPDYLDSLFAPRNREKIILPFHRKPKAIGFRNKRPKNVAQRKARRVNRR